MSNRELRNSRIKEKAGDMLSFPFLVLFGNKVLLAVVCLFAVSAAVLGSIWASGWANGVRGELSLSSYVPNGEYAGTLDGKPFTMLVDSEQRTADGQSVVLSMQFWSGDQKDYYLSFEKGSFHIFSSSKGGTGNVLQKDANGKFSVAKREGKPPWLTFSAV